MFKNEKGGGDLLITVKSNAITISMILLFLAVIFAIGIDDVAAAHDVNISYDSNLSSNSSAVNSSVQTIESQNNQSTTSQNTNTSGSNQSSSLQSNNQKSPDPQIYLNGIPVARGIYPAGHVFGTIQEAINAAQIGDTIMLEDGATFYERITVDKALTFSVFNNGHATIDGSSGGRVVIITATSGTVTFNDITFTHGSINGNGGAIYNNNAGTALVLNNCDFTSNTVSRTTGNTDVYGGAVYSRGALNINNCNFTSNTAVSGSNNEGYGGAIYCIGTLTITGSNFTSNSVNSVSGTRTDDGGAIYCTGSLTVTNCNFTGNSARDGGAIWSSNTLNVASSNFGTNTATRNGGAIYKSNGSSNITGSNFEQNTAQTGNHGSAIYNNNGNAEIHLNRIINNTSTTSQIHRQGGTVNIINNWWGDNNGSTGKVTGTVTATTWIVLTVTASPTSIPVSGTSTVTADLNHLNNGNLVSGGYVPDGILVEFTSTLGPINPVSAATLNGIATATFTGSNSGIATVNATVDGVNVGTTIIVGTDIYVSDTRGNDNTGDGSQANPYKTIAKGISMVSPGGTVNIENGTYTGTGNVNIPVSSSITIAGESRDSTIIDGQNANRIFIISSGYTVTLSNLTLTNGLASNSNGGAVQNNGGTLTVNNCVLTNNRASRTGSTDANDVYGGAIYNTGTLTIIDSIFNGNAAVSGQRNEAYGGAIYSTGAITITNSTFTSNSVSSSSGTSTDDGGAIYTNSNLTITGSSFTSNTAGQDGGAIYSNSNLSITDSSFTSNACSMTNNGAGGAICIGDGSILGMTLTITNSTFTSNSGQHGGALWTNAGSSANPATITNTTFTGNTGTYGGAVRNWGILNIIKSSFTGNSGTEGGAINNYNSGRAILTVTESYLINNAATSGGAVYADGGTAEIHFNAITGNTGTDLYLSAGTLNGQNNWWGNNYQGSNPLTAGRVNTGVNAATWLVLNIAASPNLIHVGETSTVTADLTHDQNGAYYNPASGHVPDGIPVGFTGTLGTIPNSSILNGIASTTFTAGAKPGIATVTAAVDSQTVNTQITIGRTDVYVSTTGDDTTGDGSQANPLRTIAAGIAGVYPGGTLHIASGTYNEHDLTINKDMAIVGTSAASTIINAQQLGRILDIASGTVTIQNITLANGTVTGNGGAISNAGTLTITGTNLLNNAATGSGSAIYNTGTVEMHFNRILGTGNVIASPSGSVDATLNWWVSNDDPISKVSGSVDVSTWLVLRVTASPDAIKTGETAVVTADITHDNTGAYHDPALGHVPDGIEINFSSTLGTVSPGSTTLVNGIATTTFTAVSYSGVAVVNATGSPTVSTEIDILGDTVYVSPTGNDETGDGSAGNPYATIAKGVQMTAPNGALHVGSGTYTGTGNRDVTVDKNINIVGTGASSAVIDAQGQGRIFDIMSGANVVIQNITLANGSVTGDGGAISNAGTLTLTGTNLLNNTATGTGSAIYNTGTATINFNRIIGTGIVIASPSGSVNAVNNWWGDNNNPISKISGNVDVSTWLVLRATASPTNISVGGTSTITADLTHDNTGSYHDPSLGHVPDGINIQFAIDNLGIVNPASSNTNMGEVTTIFTGLASGLSTVNVTVDNQTLNLQFKIGTVDLRVRNYEWFSGRNDTYNYNEAPPYVSYVSNNGPDDATNIVVKYTIGKGFTYIGYLLWSGVDRATYDESTRTLTYYVDYLPKGGLARVIIYLQVHDIGNKTANLTTNASLVSVDQTESGSLANFETRRLIVANASDIQVTQDAIVYDSVNKTAVIRIHVKNNGPSEAPGVNVTDLLPAGLVYTGHTSGEVYNWTSGVWNVGTLANGITKTLEIYANVTATTGTLLNFASKTAPTIPYDWNGANNGQTVNLTITGIYTPTVDLRVRNYEWFSGRNDTYNYNEAPPYVSYVSNNGPNDATNIVVKYTIGKGFTYVGYLLWSGVDNATYDAATNTLTYYVNYLPKGGLARIIIYLQVHDTGNKTANLTTNASLVSVDQTESGSLANFETRRLTVANASDIKVTQNINGATGVQTTTSQDITLTVTVTNNGPNTCTGITIEDLLTGLTYVNNDGGAIYDPGTGKLTWNIVTLNSNETVTLHITVKANTTGTYKAFASKTAPTTPYDWNGANNAQTNYIIAT